MESERKLHRVKLYGELATTYGDSYIEVYASSVKEIFQNLCSRFGDKFKQTILEGSWHLTNKVEDNDLPKSKDSFLVEDEVDLPYQPEELHVFPAVSGSKGGVGRIILGVVLIVIAIVITVVTEGAAAGSIGAAIGEMAPAIAVAGVVSIAGGIMQLLTKPPSMGDYGGAADKKQSFIFNGAINNTEQGVPVPLVYGEHLTGTTIVSAGLDVEQLI